MKIIITGRRAANLTRAKMESHMLDIHGPMVVAEAGDLIERYVQNHVVDATYGVDAPSERDMVAELTLLSGVAPRPPSAAIQADEKNFADPTDRFFMTVEETVVVAGAPDGTGGGRGCKVLAYLKRPDGMSRAAFSKAWARLDAEVAALGGLTGYARNLTAGPADALHPAASRETAYDGVAALWFGPDRAAAGLDAWQALVAASPFSDPAAAFALIVKETVLVPSFGPMRRRKEAENAGS